MEVGLVRRIDIDHEMQQSYLDYAMSVIVSRALPDARDGLKPVQRRILYAMYDMGLRPDSAYKKSARIVGEVLGKYHPHGDLAVYEAMARMAQDFSMRNILVDGQGNFGSVDGDPPAAMRYTEARLTRLAMEMLNQLDRNTVDYLSNFDETLREPEVLPAAIPNLLVNGTSGIAVGMATSIPPHNLTEVIDALVYMLSRWNDLDEVSVSDLMQFVKGPDFPTGGIILQESDKDDLLSAYATGRGRVVVRGRVHLEEMGRGRSRIIITELPYQTNKAALMERIADLVREGELEGIADLRDESDRQGMRIVVELNKAAEQEKVIRELYKRTSLQNTFRISLLALVDNEPRLLSLKQALRVYLEHRILVVKRRSEYDLNKAQQRSHILEGLRVALKNLDDVIALIRRAADVDQARIQLMKKYKLDEIQAQAILDMPLRRLASLERKKIEDEYKELQKLIHDLEALLSSPKKMRQAVETELLEMKQVYGDKRRTQIVRLGEGEVASNLLTASDLTPGAATWVGITEEGKIGRSATDQLPSLEGLPAMRWVMSSNTHHTLYLVNKDGRAAAVPVHALPEVENFQQGVPYHKVSAFEETNGLAGVFSVPPQSEIKEERFVVSVTRKGMVKKTAVQELPGPSSQIFTLTKVNEGDELGWLILTDGNKHLFLATANGMAIRFNEQDVRPMGLVAAGVNGLKLADADEVVGAEAVTDTSQVLLISTDGKGWRMSISQYPLQGRYGQGVIAARFVKNARMAAMVAGKPTQTTLVRFLQSEPMSLQIREVKESKRASIGMTAVSVKSPDQVVGVTPITLGLVFWQPELAETIEQEGKPTVRKRSSKLEQLSLLGNGDGASSPAKKASADGKAKPVKKSAAAEKKPAAANKTTEPKKAAAPKVETKKPAVRKAASAVKTVEEKPPAKKPAAKKAEAVKPAEKPVTAKARATAIPAKPEAKAKAAATGERPASKAKTTSISDKPSAKATPGAKPKTTQKAKETPAKPAATATRKKPPAEAKTETPSTEPKKKPSAPKTTKK